MEKLIARIFEDIGGYFYCDDSLDYLDTRGGAYSTLKAAKQAAKRRGFTHAAVGKKVYSLQNVYKDIPVSELKTPKPIIDTSTTKPPKNVMPRTIN